MKKIVALLLALVMLTGLTVTALAAGEKSGTTKLTAKVPGPDYTIHIPADMELEYGNTDQQEIGSVYVTDVENCTEVVVRAPYTDLKNTSDETDTLSLILYYVTSSDAYEVNKESGERDVGGVPCCYFSSNYYTLKYAAKVSDWSGATAGATYQAVVTFNFNLE